MQKTIKLTLTKSPQLMKEQANTCCRSLVVFCPMMIDLLQEISLQLDACVTL